MATNYVGDPYMQKFMSECKESAESNLEKYKNDNNNFNCNTNNEDNSDEHLNIFINFSQNSNSFVNFLHDDKKKFINKTIKIYLLRMNGIIEKFIGPLYVDDEELNKIYSTLGFMKFDYNTDYIDTIKKYISDNSIKNYYIYY
jgi:hypothetical protein